MDEWLKAAGSGLVASLVMFVVLALGIHVTGFAPFNMPPSAAFLEVLGLNTGPLPLFAHFGYGAFWSIVLVRLYGGAVDVKKGLTLAGGLWLFMMGVYSPVIGWGFFGFGTAGQMAESAPLYLEPGPKYAVLTFVLHALYGAIVGKMNAMLVSDDADTSSAVRAAA
ncbi:MAG: hypothetical protein ABEL76_15440 [Bradymonadaceae bacterium]